MKEQLYRRKSWYGWWGAVIRRKWYSCIVVKWKCLTSLHKLLCLCRFDIALQEDKKQDKLTITNMSSKYVTSHISEYKKSVCIIIIFILGCAEYSIMHSIEICPMISFISQNASYSILIGQSHLYIYRLNDKSKFYCFSICVWISKPSKLLFLFI